MTDRLTAHYRSPIGLLEIIGSEDGIASVLFVEEAEVATTVPAALGDCIAQLDEYFNGTRREFSLKLDLHGTEFQKSVWRELLKIPFGKTLSYLDIARGLGNRNAIRAVGSANGRNPVCIIVPCHRVIGTDGSLTGYGGGLWRKEWLLRFEQSTRQTSFFDHDHAQTESRHARR